MTQSQRIVIKPGSKNKGYWKDIWNFRGLFYFLSWRDIIVRYKQTAIGLAWSVLRPLITIIVFTLVFNKVANFPIENSFNCIANHIFLHSSVIYFSITISLASDNFVVTKSIAA